jgi:lysophospholipase L1-like esterase
VNRIKSMAIAVLMVAVIAALLGFAYLFCQGRQKPNTGSEYVALGSSFAAGLGLGPRIPGSPIICQRSVNGYPQQLARMMGLSLTDMSCSGATTNHVLRGGQVFLGPQIDALGQGTRLVTITAGGNDIGYVGDLTAMAFRRSGGVKGFLVGRFGKEAQSVTDRKFDQLQADLIATLREISRRAPHARIFVVTYPVILPPKGTCSPLGISADEAELMRQVGARLAETTRGAAIKAGVSVIDMDQHSVGHDACGPAAWVNGAAPDHGAPFHPTLAGARATAEYIKLAFEKAG